MRELIFVNENIESQIKDQEERMEVCFLAFCCKFSPLRTNHAVPMSKGKLAGGWKRGRPRAPPGWHSGTHLAFLDSQQQVGLFGKTKEEIWEVSAIKALLFSTCNLGPSHCWFFSPLKSPESSPEGL